MVSAPGFGVHLKHAAGDFPLYGVPGSPIAFRVPHDQIWRILDVGPDEGGAAVEDMPDRFAARLRVHQPLPFPDELALQLSRFFSGFDRAEAFPAFLVDEDPIETERIGSGALPIHVLEPVFPCGAALECQVAVLMQPGVQVDAALERLEAVVGDDQQQGLPVHLRERAADKVVHAPVQILDDAFRR